MALLHLYLFIYLAVQPPVWLVNASTSHSYTAFTKGVTHQELPTAEAMPLKKESDQERFVVRWLADLITIYIRFASHLLHAETDNLVATIKAALVKMKGTKRKREGEDAGKKVKKRRLKTDASNTDVDGKGFSHSFTQ